MGVETIPYDAAEFLTDDETIAAYLIESLESDDIRIITEALGAVARARGKIEFVRNTGITPETRIRLGDALSALSCKINLTNEDFEVFNQVRDKTPAEPLNSI